MIHFIPLFSLLISLWITDDTSVIDIDGNHYKTVPIGKQIWLAENLKTSRYRNGDLIPEAADNTAWEKASGAWCYYNNDSSLGKIYGKLYNWEAAADPRGICPVGWHIPSDDEWQALSAFLGGKKSAGGKMKTAAGWETPNKDADNSSGFTALPAGVRYFKGSSFYLKRYTGFWSVTEASPDLAWIHFLESTNAALTRQFFGKKNGFSCRCVKDDN